MEEFILETQGEKDNWSYAVSVSPKDGFFQCSSYNLHHEERDFIIMTYANIGGLDQSMQVVHCQ